MINETTKAVVGNSLRLSRNGSWELHKNWQDHLIRIMSSHDRFTRHHQHHQHKRMLPTSISFFHKNFHQDYYEIKWLTNSRMDTKGRRSKSSKLISFSCVLVLSCCVFIHTTHFQPLNIQLTCMLCASHVFCVFSLFSAVCRRRRKNNK